MRRETREMIRDAAAEMEARVWDAIAVLSAGSQEGADHFLAKPVDMKTLLVILERLIKEKRNRQWQAASERARTSESFNPFLGASPAIRALAAPAERLLCAEGPLLIQVIHGETGTGRSAGPAAP